VEPSYSVFVSKDSFKFNAAHFQIYQGFRERLHGHNYRVGVRIEGKLGSDGYVLDFGDIKKAARLVCKQLNEKTIIPTANDCLEVSSSDGQISLVCQDGSRFSLPQDDCVLLPIAHSSAEELAEYVCGELIKSLKIPGRRQVCSIEVTVAEAPGQEAVCKIDL